MPLLTDHATPCPPEYQLELSYVELKDEVAQAEAAVRYLEVATRHTVDPWRKARLTDQLGDAYAHLDAITRLYEAALYGEPPQETG